MGSAGSSKSFTLYTRQSCGLCDYFALALELLRPRYNFRYEMVDVDDSATLAERYGVKVPVLVDKDFEICSGHCDPAIIEAYLAQD